MVFEILQTLLLSRIIDMDSCVLDIQNLDICIGPEHHKIKAVSDFNLRLDAGKNIGIIGESGSGKTLSMLAATRLLPNSGSVTSGKVYFKGHNVLEMPRAEFHRRISGKEIAMIFQEPMTALNPVYTIGHQLQHTYLLYNNESKHVASVKSLAMLKAVKLSNPKERMNQYPHELSGGQRQRVLIAMGLINKPSLLIADEPTTALDVTVQKEIIELLMDLQKMFEMSMIFISHDLAVVSKVADRLLVMRHGEVVEKGKADRIFFKPTHIYTKTLLKSLAKLDKPFNQNQNQNKSNPPILRINNISKTFRLPTKIFSPIKTMKVLGNIKFDVFPGETLAIVGESGSGKSTLAKIINGLLPADSGQVKLNEEPVCKLEVMIRSRLLQPIFQDPYSTLNPAHTVGKIVARPLFIHKIVKREDIYQEVASTLDLVGLPDNFSTRFPNQLSGGQRQRVAIARAIILKPKILICDEPTSALDLSIQEQILDLVNNLKSKFGMTIIIISHDMGVVRYLADRVIVMLEGKIVESGTASQILESPRSDYTKRLVNSVYRI